MASKVWQNGRVDDFRDEGDDRGKPPAEADDLMTDFDTTLIPGSEFLNNISGPERTPFLSAKPWWVYCPSSD